ncbi:MAG: diguanylate cyclase [Phycisphaerae bacterium]|nr:diguanylate cyclase [Phycisphaerae bacterium]
MDEKILIVDDDQSMLLLLEKYLADSGYEVLQATNGQEALHIVLAEAPRIVITDWMMPEMDGLELCRALRAHEGVRLVYIIIVTAHSDVDHIVEAFEAGADEFLSKPVRKAEFLARLRAGNRIIRAESDLQRRTLDIHRLNAEMAVANEKLELANDKLKRMATTDELTGLLNRREAMNRLRALWNSLERYGHVFSCIMVDIDHFKRFNDTYGHATGDAVLRETGAVLQTNIRTTDMACRLGGEEFLILCPNVSARGAAVCAENLRAAFESHEFGHEGVQMTVTISLGVAEWGPHLTRPDDLLSEADSALYESKKAGRNRVTIAGGGAEEAVRCPASDIDQNVATHCAPDN